MPFYPKVDIAYIRPPYNAKVPMVAQSSYYIVKWLQSIFSHLLLSVSSLFGSRIEREKIWYRNRIQKLCKRGNEEEALKLFEEMKANRIYPEVVMFNNLIAALGRKGKVKDAFKLFNDVSNTHHFEACCISVRHSV